MKNLFLNSKYYIDNYIATYGTTEEKSTKYEDNINVLIMKIILVFLLLKLRMIIMDINYLPYIKISGGRFNDEW